MAVGDPNTARMVAVETREFIVFLVVGRHGLGRLFGRFHQARGRAHDDMDLATVVERNAGLLRADSGTIILTPVHPHLIVSDPDAILFVYRNRRIGFGFGGGGDGLNSAELAFAKGAQQKVETVVAVSVPRYIGCAFTVHGDVGVPVVGRIFGDRVGLRPLATVQILEENSAMPVAKALPHQPQPARGVAFEAMIQVGTGFGGESLYLTPAAAFHGNCEQVPANLLGIARGIVDLLRPHEPGDAGCVHGDLRHPDVAGDAGDREGRGP